MDRQRQYILFSFCECVNKLRFWKDLKDYKLGISTKFSCKSLYAMTHQHHMSPSTHNLLRVQRKCDATMWQFWLWCTKIPFLMKHNVLTVRSCLLTLHITSLYNHKRYTRSRFLGRNSRFILTIVARLIFITNKISWMQFHGHQYTYIVLCDVCVCVYTFRVL